MENTVQDEIGRLSLEERQLLLFRAKQLLADRASQSYSKDSKQLIAYVTADEKFNSKELKRSLKTKVPEYMVPSRIIRIDKFPLLPNGKIDKKALRFIRSSPKEVDADSIAQPTNEVEKKLLAIWKEVLNLNAIGIHDNFFEIGGDSILSIQVIAKARSAGMPLSPNQLFQCQTISDLASIALTKKQQSKAKRPKVKLKHLVAIRPKGSRPPLFCLHSGGTHFFFYNLFASYLDSERPVYALQASPHEGEIKLHGSIDEMASDFIAEIKKVQPHGPYHLMSYCYNTAIGLEMARVLRRNSESVNLIIADTMADYLSLFAASRTTERATAFFERLKAAPFKTCKALFKDKVIDPFREKWKSLTSTGSEKVVLQLHNNHIKLYSEYEWKSFEGNIQLLLTQKKESGFNEGVIDSWKKVIDQEVKVVPVEGHHDRLFEGPIAEKTAASIEACMRDFEKS